MEINLKIKTRIVGSTMQEQANIIITAIETALDSLYQNAHIESVSWSREDEKND